MALNNHYLHNRCIFVLQIGIIDVFLFSQISNKLNFENMKIARTLAIIFTLGTASVEGEPFNRTAKIAFYQLMGYSVYDMHDNLIPQQKTNNPIK